MRGTGHSPSARDGRPQLALRPAPPAPAAAASPQALLLAARWLVVLTPTLLVLGMVPADIGASAVAVVFLAAALRRNDFAWLAEPWVVVALFLCGFASIRDAFTPHALGSVAQALVWVRFILFGAALQHWVLAEKEWRVRLLYGIAAAVAFLAADALWQCATGVDILGRHRWFGRLTGPYRRPRLGITLAWLFLPAVLGLHDRGRSVAAGLLCALAVAAIVLSGDRMALIFALAALGLGVALSPSLWRTAIVGLPVVLLLVGGIFLAAPNAYKRQVGSTANVLEDVPDSPYGIIWRSALRIAEDHPIVGVGVHNYRYVCLQPRYGPPQVPTSGGAPAPRCSTHPHNIYLEWLVGLGALGLAGFVLLIGLLAVRLALGLVAADRDLFFVGLAVTALLRMWPIQSSTSFFVAWSSVPFWLVVGGALSCLPRPSRPAVGRPSRGGSGGGP